MGLAQWVLTKKFQNHPQPRPYEPPKDGFSAAPVVNFIDVFQLCAPPRFMVGCGSNFRQCTTKYQDPLQKSQVPKIGPASNHESEWCTELKNVYEINYRGSWEANFWRLVGSWLRVVLEFFGQNLLCQAHLGCPSQKMLDTSTTLALRSVSFEILT